MIDRKRPCNVFLPLALCAAVTLFAACGDTTKKSTAPASTSGQAAVTVGMSACTTCHTVVTADWLTSKHANLDPGGALDSPGIPTSAQVAAGACASCHDPLGDSNNLTAGYTGAAGVKRPVIGCEACHGPGSVHADAGGSGAISLLSGTYVSTSIGSTTVSGQFAMCTNCHELLDSTGTMTNPDPAHSSTPPTGSQYTITDTHFATGGNYSGTSSANINNITGYTMNYARETVCTDCHNPHKQANINREWAQSAHGDRTTNYSSDLATQDPQGYFGGAWAHYNWSCDGLNAAACGTSATTGLPTTRATCQRCHTTTGFIAYAEALRGGEADLAEAIRHGTVIAGASPPLSSDATWKPEMLTCSGCHSDNRGALRNPGTITADYSAETTTNGIIYKLAEVSYTYPNVDKSNVCLACHVGRESGDTIKNLSLTTAPSITTFGNVGFRNSHYLTAGGTIFTATGYEFPGRSYENPTSYMHNQIGMGNFKDTGNAGPCVGCHMSRPNKNGNHLFLPVSRFNPVRYNTGTVSVTKDSTTVTGAGTAWLSAAIDMLTDRFHGPDARDYLISAVSDSQITLTSPYRGSNGSGKAYAVLEEGERITGITSEICFNCHAGTSAMLVEMLNSDREFYEESLFALEHALDKRKISFKPSSPYFFTKRYNTGLVSVTAGSTVVTGIGTLFTSASITATSDKFRVYDGGLYDIQIIDSDTQLTLKTPFLGATNTAGISYAVVTGTSLSNWDPDEIGDYLARNNMGAAFNFNLMEHDPGAYVHNRTYLRRLLYDALDWIDDYQLNYSVGQTLKALGNEPYKNRAIQYLLPNGVLGIEAERP